MNAEIIGIGTELLLGQIANTNAQKISAALATIGVDVFWHSVVGDNLDRIAEAVERAMDRSDVVICTGGLGPTPDDITREAVALALGRPVVRDQRLAADLRAFFERRGRSMPDANLQQADLPEGALPIEPEGTAPGFYLELGSSLLVALPGVPWEMQHMMDQTVLPLLRRRGGELVTVSREVLVVGLGESHTHQLIADIVDAQTNPTIAYLAGFGLVRVRVTAKAPSHKAALALIRPVETVIRERLGDAAVPGDGADLAGVLGSALRARGATAAAAESLTGGLIGAALTAAEGSTDFFRGAVVVYDVPAKRDVLGVDESVLEEHGPVSEETARLMAAAVASKFGADLGLSATGVAGPAEHDGMPVGTIFVGAAFEGRSEVRLVRGYGDRDNVRGIAVTAALDLGRRVLQSPAADDRG